MARGGAETSWTKLRPATKCKSTLAQAASMAMLVKTRVPMLAASGLAVAGKMPA